MSNIKELVEKRQQMVQEADDKYAEICEQLKSSKEKAESLSQEKEELIRKLRLRTLEVERKQKGLKEISDKYNRTLQKKERFEGLVNVAKNEQEKMEELEEENRTMQSDLQQSEFGLSEAERRHRKIQGDLETVRRRHNGMSVKTKEIEAQVDEISGKMAELSRGQDFDEDGALDRQQELETKIRELSVGNEELGRRVRNLSQQKIGLQTQLNSLVNSTNKVKEEMATIECELLG